MKRATEKSERTDERGYKTREPVGGNVSSFFVVREAKLLKGMEYLVACALAWSK
jgi:hypothetical protein